MALMPVYSAVISPSFFYSGLMALMEEASDGVSEELRLKSMYLRRTLRPVINMASSALEVLADKAQIITDAVRDMYRANSFYLRDIYDAACHSVDAIK